MLPAAREVGEKLEALTLRSELLLNSCVISHGTAPEVERIFRMSLSQRDLPAVSIALLSAGLTQTEFSDEGNAAIPCAVAHLVSHSRTVWSVEQLRKTFGRPKHSHTR